MLVEDRIEVGNLGLVEGSSGLVVGNSSFLIMKYCRDYKKRKRKRDGDGGSNAMCIYSIL